MTVYGIDMYRSLSKAVGVLKSNLAHSKKPRKSEYIFFCYYEGKPKRKGKIHLTDLIEVTVSNFTYHFSTQSPYNTMHLLYRSTGVCIPAEKKLFGCAMLMVDQDDLHQ